MSALTLPSPPPAETPWALLRSVIDARLARLLHESVDARPDPLLPAMRHALLGPGKRLRPTLVLLAGRELGAPTGPVLDAACAVEMVHAASLVLDDLPAMDNASLRRGAPSTHALHGEAVAILAAVALIARAFAVLQAVESAAAQRSGQGGLVGVLAKAIGSEGLAGGQWLDLHMVPCSGGAGPAGEAGALSGVEQVCACKTGALFIAAVSLTARIAGAPRLVDARLQSFAAHLGQAYQVLDDLQDAATGEDARPTSVSLLGAPEARLRLQRHLQAARARLPSPDGPLARFVDALFGPAEAAPAHGAGR
jgi:geranylgeranyl diphosphate synthase, type II